MAESLVYTCEQARQLLRPMSKDTFYAGIKAGTIPAIKIAERKILIPKAMFHAWLDGKLPKNELTRTESNSRAGDEVTNHDYTTTP